MPARPSPSSTRPTSRRRAATRRPRSRPCAETGSAPELGAPTSSASRTCPTPSGPRAIGRRVSSESVRTARARPGIDVTWLVTGRRSEENLRLYRASAATTTPTAWSPAHGLETPAHGAGRGPVDRRAHARGDVTLASSPAGAATLRTMRLGDRDRPMLRRHRHRLRTSSCTRCRANCAWLPGVVRPGQVAREPDSFREAACPEDRVCSGRDGVSSAGAGGFGRGRPIAGV